MYWLFWVQSLSSQPDAGEVFYCLYCMGSNSKNFSKTMLNASKIHNTVHVVNDHQIGTSTYIYDLIPLLVYMNETEKYGYCRTTNWGGYISWYDFWRY